MLFRSSLVATERPVSGRGPPVSVQTAPTRGLPASFNTSPFSSWACGVPARADAAKAPQRNKANVIRDFLATRTIYSKLIKFTPALHSCHLFSNLRASSMDQNNFQPGPFQPLAGVSSNQGRRGACSGSRAALRPGGSEHYLGLQNLTIVLIYCNGRVRPWHPTTVQVSGCLPKK